MADHKLPAELREKTLEQLEGIVWGPPEIDSGLVQSCHQLRRKPLTEFSIGDLSTMIGQDIGSEYLVPLAIEQLAMDPLAEAVYYPGDLLYSALQLPATFWKEHVELRSELEALLARVDDAPEFILGEIERFRASSY